MKHNKVTLFFVLGLIVNCANLVGSNTVSKVDVDQTTGEKTYTTTYPFLLKEGLVEVREELSDLIQYSYPEECKKMSVTVGRQSSKRLKQVIVTAKLKKECKDIWEGHGYEPFFPMYDDTVCEDGSKSKCKVRAGNRLHMKLQIQADYHIQVPHDADLTVNLAQGDINYTAGREIPTQLSIQSSTVTYPGDNGSSTTIDQTLMEVLCGEKPERRQQWDYYWGRNTNPKTMLKTKKGHVALPASSEDQNPWYRGLMN